MFHIDTISYLFHALIGQQTQAVVEIKEIRNHKSIRMMKLITAHILINAPVWE